MPMPSAWAWRGFFSSTRAVADVHRSGVGPVDAHDALDQRALAGAVLAQQRTEAAGPQCQRHVGERLQRTESFGDIADLDDGRRSVRGERRRCRSMLWRAATLGSGENALSSRSWKHLQERLGGGDGAEHASLHRDHFHGRQMIAASVAPQQSSSNKHSKPRSLASRMVVWTQTSVVMPLRIKFLTPRRCSINSRSVA